MDFFKLCSNESNPKILMTSMFSPGGHETSIESLVLEGSAHVSGEVQPGDKIPEIDGKSVASSKDVHEK